jgi:antirestriction protein ArdC
MQTTTTSIHEAITQRVIQAIEGGQTPPWRRAISDRENDGFPARPATLEPYKGVDVLLLNMSATEKGVFSRFWACEEEWTYLDCIVSGKSTTLADGTPVFNGDQTVSSIGSMVYRSRRRRTPVAVDYSPAEAVIAASGADIRHLCGTEAAYYYQEDVIIFPEKWQFVQGPGGLEAYYDSLFHELVHFTEPRLGWSAPSAVNELRAEIGAPFMMARLNISVLTDMTLLPNHHDHLTRWVRAMKTDPRLIIKVAQSASEAVEYLLALRRS